MARAITIKESVAELETLERHYKGEVQEVRLTMLKHLKDDSSLTLAEIASRLESSERSIQRWLAEYRKGGLEALMRFGSEKAQKSLKIGDDVLEALKEKLDRGELSTLKEIQRWLKRRHGIQYSIAGIWNLVNVRLKNAKAADSSQIPAPSIPSPQPSPLPSKPVDSYEPLLQFLNGLPYKADIMELIEVFRVRLQALLGDVDRISVNVRVSSNLDHRTDAPSKNINVTHYTAFTIGQGSKIVVTDVNDARPADRLLTNLRAQNLPVDQYHPPHAFDYYAGEHSYVGTIILWRELSKSEISEHTLGLMTRLQPFLTFLFSDLIVRYQQSRPFDNIFQEVLKSMAEQFRLTPQERKIVVQQLLGYSYKEIADTLDISLDTVKHHIKSIHTKTNTRSQGELFARYFSPRPELEKYLQA